MLIAIQMKARPEMPAENLVSLQVSLISLAFRCYPEQINLVDKVLESALLALDKTAMEKYFVLFSIIEVIGLKKTKANSIDIDIIWLANYLIGCSFLFKD